MKRVVLSLCLLVAYLGGDAQQKANYKLAEKFTQMGLSGIAAKNSLRIVPQYIHDGEKFWFEFRTDEGTMFYFVDPEKAEKRLLFKNTDIAQGVSNITRKAYNEKNLQLSNVDFSKDMSKMTFSLGGGDYEYNMKTKKVKELPKKEEKEEMVMYTWMSLSPDSNYIVYAKNHNLYMRGNKYKGQDTTEIQLTTNGERYFSYARNGQDTVSDETEMAGRWFKKVNKVYILRQDQREVEEMAVINALAKPKPVLERYKYDMAGAKNLSKWVLSVVDIDKRKVVDFDIERWQDQDAEVRYVNNKGNKIFFERYTRVRDEMELCVGNTETGEVKVLIHEVDKPYIDFHMHNIVFLNEGNDILYRSERTGWAHYYHYDGNGVLKNTITSGDWVAGQIAAIDTVGRTIYLYAHGYDKKMNPYYYQVLKANIDREGVSLLTPEDGQHGAIFSKSRKYFIDSYSRVDMEPRFTLKDNNGRVIIKDLAKPDLRRAYEMGWKAPERFVVKAADGLTDLHGIMWKPADFDPNKKYPIISSVYPGPFFEYVNTSFSLDDSYNMKLAQLGFIVVSMGHRGGSPMRGKFYHRYGYGNLRDYPLADDKYAIEQLADRHSYIDITKVGIFGHSGGGFMSTAALCTYPDFYTAAVSSSGNHDNNIYNNGWVEIHHGVKESKKMVKDSVNGDHEVSSFSVKVPTNMELAKNLKGHLLIVTGDMDKNVHPAHTLRMVDALIEAGKNFDMLVLPGKGHGYGSADRFFERKLWYHFAKYLLGDTTADHYGNIEEYKGIEN